MNRKNIIILIGVVIFLAVLTISIVNEKESAHVESDITGKAFLPELEANINNAALLEIIQGSSSITLKRDGSEWQVAQSSNYPADFSQIRTVLLALADLKTIEAKTRKSENYARLGVDNPSDGVTSKQISVEDTSGIILANLIIGNPKPAAGGKSSLYVRNANDDQAWLVEGQVNVQIAVQNWLDKSIMNINQASIKQVTIIQADKKELTISKEAQTDMEFKIKGLKEGKIAKPGMLNNIVSAIANLNLEDVTAKEHFEFDKKHTVTTRFETFDGLIVTASIMEKDARHFAQFEASFNEMATVSDQPTEANTQESFNIVGAASQQAAMLNQKLQTWVYIIPSFKANHFITKKEDIVE